MTGRTWDHDGGMSLVRQAIMTHHDEWHDDLRIYLMDVPCVKPTPRARFNVWWAFITNNWGGHKREDVHGRRYRSVYRKFGNKSMAREFMYGNSWGIKTWHYGVKE